MSFKTFLAMLYTAGFTFALTVFLVGMPYYQTPLSERPHSPFHEQLKPGGIWGHGLGVIGSAMILLLFLYVLRRRRLLGLRWGSMKRWLDIHIFFGIMGPLLVTLHTAMKFNGVVSIGFFAMVAVVVSGVFGRYVYMQIPRDAKGHALELRQIHAWDKHLNQVLTIDYGVPDEIMAEIDSLSAVRDPDRSGSLRALMAALSGDAVLWIRIRRLRRNLESRSDVVLQDVVDEVLRLARQKSTLRRRIAFLDSMKRTFHLWHVIHRPFAYVMVGIMILHVVVTVSLGYRWIF